MNNNSKNKIWLQAHKSKKIYPFEITEDQIDIHCIAHSLARLCRFNGHCSVDIYSVAQHSVLVSQYCDSKDALYGLLHDGSEHLSGDCNSNIKKHPSFQFYRDLENQIQSLIYKKYCGGEVEPVSVKKADQMLLNVEALNFMQPIHPDWELDSSVKFFNIDPLSPKQSEALFMKRFYELTGSLEKYDEFIQSEFGGADPLK